MNYTHAAGYRQVNKLPKVLNDWQVGQIIFGLVLALIAILLFGALWITKYDFSPCRVRAGQEECFNSDIRVWIIEQ